MIIVVIGCDATGKSTRCEELSKETGYPVIHMDKPEPGYDRRKMFSDYKKLIEMSDNVIFDRFFYCEEVYGPIMRDKSAISLQHHVALEQLLRDKGVRLIYCWDYAEAIYKRFQKTGEDHVTTLSQVLCILQGYHEVLSNVRGIEIEDCRMKGNNEGWH